MSVNKKLVMSLLAVLSMLSCFASATDTLLKRRAAKSAPVVPGQWHAGFSKVKQYAVDNGLPFVAVWSRGDDCSHCVKLEKNFNANPFYAWQKTSGIVYWFGYEGDSGEDSETGAGVRWTSKDYTNTDLPLVRLYWKAKAGTRLTDGRVLTKDQVLVDITTKGDKVDNYKAPSSDKSKDGSTITMNYIKNKFKLFSTEVPVEYAGGEFPMGDAVNSRLQAEVGLTKGGSTLDVPIVRATEEITQDYTNALEVVGVDGKVSTNKIAWVSGMSSTKVGVKLPATLTAGKQIAIYLLDAYGARVATNHIDIVAAKENAPGNPYWVGTKTVKTLDWGEWTMDLDIAKNKVSAQSGEGTLVLVTGSQWCPDCASTEKWLLESDEFKSYVSDKKLAFVTIDIPKIHNNAKVPSLLTYDASTTSERFYTYNYSPVTNLDLKVMGGAGYRSRNAITDEAAEEIAARNLDLVTNSVVNGGICRVDMLNEKNSLTGVFKTGIPALIMLRPDGSVSGRIYQFNNISPNGDDDPSYLERFKDLYATLSVKETEEEEANDIAATAGDLDALALRKAMTERSLSFVDQADYYLLSDDVAGNDVTVSVTGTKSAEVTISFVNFAKNKEVELASNTGDLSLPGGVSCHYVVPNNCFIKVSYPMDSSGNPQSGSFFDAKSGVSTICQYSLETDILLKPQAGAAQSYHISDFTTRKDVRIAVVEGLNYEITNLDTGNAAFAEYFTAGATKNVYVANKTDSAQCFFTSADFTYRQWDAGKIGFASAAMSVSESDGSFNLVIQRVGGKSGKAQVRLSLVDDRSTKLSEIFVWDGDKQHVWNDQESDDWVVPVDLVDNEFCDGNLLMCFSLKTFESDAGVDPNFDDILVTVKDNDRVLPGVLALGNVDPATVRDLTIYARKGSEVTFDVCRTGGSTGVASGKLTVTAGGSLDETAFKWDNRDAQSYPVKLTLANDAPATVKVTLSGLNGMKTDASKRYLTVKTVAADAPGFAENEKLISGYRYTKLDDVEIAVDAQTAATASDLTIKKLSGSLVDGLSIVKKLSGASPKLVVTGTPKKAGSSTVVYQLFDGKTAGTTVAITVNVIDPVAQAAASDPQSPGNPAVAKTFTCADIRVIKSSTKVLSGLLTVTVPRTGRVSAKLRTVDGETVSYSASGWSAYDEATGALTATLKHGSDDTFDVKVNRDGTLEIDEIASGYEVIVPAAQFSATSTADEDLSAKDWSGYYTLQMPVDTNTVSGSLAAYGCGYLTLKLTNVNTGKMKYAGMLPDGKCFSGTANLCPEDWNDGLTPKKWNNASLAVMASDAKNSLSGLVDIDREMACDTTGSKFRKCVSVADDPVLFWNHEEVSDEVSGSARLNLYGGKYVETENWKEMYRSIFNVESDTDPVKANFYLLPQYASYFCDCWQVSGWDVTGYGLTLNYNTKKKVNSFALDKKAAKGFKFTFNPSTGIVTGTVLFNCTCDIDEAGEVTLNFRGIVTPGWGYGGCSECTMADLYIRPFIAGSAFLTDTLGYTDERKRMRTLKFTRSCPFSVGVQPGL